MTVVRLRHLAQVNPATPAFDRLHDNDEVTFLPMEVIWPDDRLDISQRRVKATVSTGYTRFQDGDILIPKITPTFEAARSVLISGLYCGVGAGTTELHVLRPTNDIDARFLLYVTNTHSFLRLGKAEMYGVAGQQRVPDEFIRDYAIELPSLTAQRRIADFLDAETARLDKMTQLRSRQLALHGERFVARLRDIVAGTNDHSTDQKRISWLGPIRETWETTTVNRISHFIMGTTFPHEYQGDKFGDYPFIKVSDFTLADDSLHITSAKNWISNKVAAHLGARIVPTGSVLYARVGAALLLNRRVVTTKPSIVDDNVRAIFFREGNPLYWANLLSILDMGKLANPGPVPSISESQVASVRITFPPTEAQDDIVKAVECERNLVHRSRKVILRQVELLTERRQALITAAVTGQFDVSTASGRGVTE